MDGHDACRKICILAALAFGQHVYPDQVPTQGIRGVTLADVAYADSCGYKIKLLGRAIREPDGKVCAYVAPHLVSCENPLAGVEDVFNAIAVTGNAVGDVMFYGRGAGKLPTASAVVADVIDIAKDTKRDHHNQWGPGAPDLVVSRTALTSRWYVRAQTTMDQARLACGEMQPLARSGAPAGEAAFLTEPHDRAPGGGALAGMEVVPGSAYCNWAARGPGLHRIGADLCFDKPLEGNETWHSLYRNSAAAPSPTRTACATWPGSSPRPISKGNSVVVVLSAQGDTTDDLIAKAEELNPNASKREMDMLLSTGEQISIALCAMAIEGMGYQVVSLTGWQAGMKTDSAYGNARIKRIDTERIQTELDKKKIVLVAGFQGINKYGDITTLGRGGSDTSAVALAAALHADLCQIYTDVDGVYTADPRTVKGARKLEEITFDEMLELASLGAQVLHNRSVEMAKRYNVNLEVLSSFYGKSRYKSQGGCQDHGKDPCQRCGEG